MVRLAIDVLDPFILSASGVGGLPLADSEAGWLLSDESPSLTAPTDVEVTVGGASLQANAWMEKQATTEISWSSTSCFLLLYLTRRLDAESSDDAHVLYMHRQNDCEAMSLIKFNVSHHC